MLELEKMYFLLEKKRDGFYNYYYIFKKNRIVQLEIVYIACRSYFYISHIFTSPRYIASLEAFNIVRVGANEGVSLPGKVPQFLYRFTIKEHYNRNENIVPLISDSVGDLLGLVPLINRRSRD